MYKKFIYVLFVLFISVSAFSITIGKPAVEKKESNKDLIPLVGHTIRINNSISDWEGKLPDEDDTWIISEGEFVWRDAQGDDKGTGTYVYPQNSAFKNCADIREVRITWDKRNLYFLIKCRRPGDWWTPYRLIGIHKDDSPEPSTTVLGQGNPDDLGSENGCFGELRVAPELACQYVIGLSSTFRGRIWNSKGKLVAIHNGEEEDTPGFKVGDSNWASLEVSVPFDVIGSPAGQTWKFIIATGCQDNDYFREIEEVTTEWHAGGGEGSDDNTGPDPDIYDLAGSTKKVQESELNSYIYNGASNSSNAFALISKSYLTVKFADEPMDNR